VEEGLLGGFLTTRKPKNAASVEEKLTGKKEKRVG